MHRQRIEDDFSVPLIDLRAPRRQRGRSTELPGTEGNNFDDILFVENGSQRLKIIGFGTTQAKPLRKGKGDAFLIVKTRRRRVMNRCEMVFR